MNKSEKRRLAAISAYTGANGGGKSLAMVQDTIPSLLVGRPVLSTVRLIDPENRHGVPRDEALDAWAQIGVTDWPARLTLDYLPHPQYRPLTRWSQLLEFDFGDVLLDEILGVVSSRGHMSLPQAVGNLLHQLRRGDVLCRWTSPSYQRADLMLREVTQAVTYCVGFLGKQLPGRLWASNRAYLWRTYDAKMFDEWDPKDRESKQLKASVKQLARFSRLQAPLYYDTFAPVDHIHDADESGLCLRCGGTRRRSKCECPKDARRPQRSEDAALPSQPHGVAA